VLVTFIISVNEFNLENSVRYHIHVLY